MPSTLTGLLLFVVLLLPGFAYLVGKERVGTERRASAFRETASVVSASVTSELVVLVLSWPLWRWSLDVDALIAAPGDYWREHPGLLTAWGLGLLTVACALAFTATLPCLRRKLPRLTGGYPHPSAVSAWWLLFEQYRQGRDRHVGVVLDDGSYMQGSLISFNQNADDIADRDLVLTAPIVYRAPNSTEKPVALDCSAACVSARRIVAMTVSYVDPPATSPTSAEAEAAASAASAE